MATSTNEAQFHFTNQLHYALLIDDVDFGLEFDNFEDLSSIKFNFRTRLRYDTLETSFRAFNKILKRCVDKLKERLQPLGYSINIRQPNINEFSKLIGRPIIHQVLTIRLVNCAISCSKTNLRLKLNSIKKELAQTKKNPFFINGAFVSEEGSNDQIGIDLQGKSIESQSCLNSEIEIDKDDALELNFNRMLNGFNFVGGYQNSYMLSLKPVRQPINLVTRFDVQFTYLRNVYLFKIDFTGDRPVAIITNKGAVVTNQFLRDENLPFDLHTQFTNKIKQYVRSLLPRSVKFGEFNVENQMLNILVSPFGKFKNVTMAVDKDGICNFITVSEEGIKTVVAGKGITDPDIQKKHEDWYLNHPELVKEIKSQNREYYRSLMISALDVPSYSVKNMYFH